MCVCLLFPSCKQFKVYHSIPYLLKTCVYCSVEDQFKSNTLHIMHIKKYTTVQNVKHCICSKQLKIEPIYQKIRRDKYNHLKVGQIHLFFIHFSSVYRICVSCSFAIMSTILSARNYSVLNYKVQLYRCVSVDASGLGSSIVKTDIVCLLKKFPLRNVATINIVLCYSVHVNVVCIEIFCR